MTKGNGPQRMTRRFAWRTVDPRLVGKLLEAAYLAAGQGDEAAKLNGLGDEQLVRTAEQALGTPPAAKHMDAMTDVLRESWLPRMDGDRRAALIEAVQLGLSDAAREARPRSKHAQVEFLRERRRTTNFKAHLRKAFLDAHKKAMVAETSSAGTQDRDSRPWLLAGEGMRDPLVPFSYQEQAWANLDDLRNARTTATSRGGLVVLPTGAGKTYTLVRWLVDAMAGQPELRVLWVADRQELVDQAARTFVEVARTLPSSFQRRLRRIHAGAGQATMLAEWDLDVAVTTRQSLRGRMDATTQKRLARFLERPTVVVVDEAHHAVAPTYEDLLDFIQARANPVLVGLTATPWPSGYGATGRLRRRFPVPIAAVDVMELIRSGVLARPLLHTIHTGERIELTDDERRVLGGGDVPPSVLRRLDLDRRNNLLVNTWLDRRDEWGKTLVFAVDIEHADRLHRRFVDAGVDALVVHSRSEMARDVALRRFREASGDTVLISVGMLTEGVDLPNAQTAFLSRPTTSRVLMRQMIGRVLRGTKTGGGEVAHVVDLRDRWTDDVEVLSAVEIPLGMSTPTGHAGPTDPEHRLPPVRDEISGEPIPEDVLYRVMRSYQERMALQPGLGTMTSATLVGFYRLDDLNVPVFDHTRPRFEQLIARELAHDKKGNASPLDLFDDLPIPRPVRGDVRAVVDYLRSQRIAPPLEKIKTVFSVRAVAHELASAGAMTPVEQRAWLLDRYESTLARTSIPSFQAFYEQVHQELLSLEPVEGQPTFDPENPPVPARTGDAKLRHATDRHLPALLQSVIAEAQTLLVGEDVAYLDLLQSPPKVDWTTEPVRSTWAYWTVRIRGRGRGKPIIRVNRALSAPRTQIPDDVLRFLLWHELVHHLLPGQGHDAEFRRLETLWPDSDKHDAFIDALPERYDLRWDR